MKAPAGDAVVSRGLASFGETLALQSGASLPGFQVAYETYGCLSTSRDNAVLICHALTSDQHAAGRHRPEDSKPGWWDTAVGPGKAIDTERFFVISSNVLGGAGGSTGPMSLDPRTGIPFGMRFPVVTVSDMVAVQERLLDRLEIPRLHAAIGGCLGGFQVLEWLSRSPQRIGRAVVISATARVSAHTIALWSVLRDAIRLDPDWRNGDYYEHGPPRRGIALLTRFGALYWMRREVLESRFGVKSTCSTGPRYTFESDFEVEAFFARLGEGAPQRFDANSFLYLSRAMDYFDLVRGGKSLEAVFAATQLPVLLISYESDWRYPPQEMELIASALRAVGAGVEHQVLGSNFGHGAFIYDFEGAGKLIQQFLD